MWVAELHILLDYVMPMDRIKIILEAMQQDPKISAAKIAVLMGQSSRCTDY